MTKDYFRYDLKVQDALRGVVRAVLAETAENGLPGDHHFFISFKTGAPGVKISEHFQEKYPDEMTIVLQHQFWGMKVDEDELQVELSFDNVTEKLQIPFAAMTGFSDPSIQFGLQFDVATANSDIVAKDTGETTPMLAETDFDSDKETADALEQLLGDNPVEEKLPSKSKKPVKGEVVQLDAFRKKN